MEKFLAIFVVLVLGIIAIWYTGSRLSKRNGTDVWLLWYLFSLTVVITSLVIWIGIGLGYISDNGGFKGGDENILSKLLHLSLDLELDLKILFGLFSIVAIPQLCAYFIAGLWGCGRPTFFISEALKFLAWNFVKSVVVADGVFLTVIIAAALNGWLKPRMVELILLFSFVCAFMSLAFIVALSIRDSESIYDDLKKVPRITKLLEKWKPVHVWLTRKSEKRVVAVVSN
jgi:hypothetical protein